jgi:hypothetical protein
MSSNRPYPVEACPLDRVAANPPTLAHSWIRVMHA